MKGRRKLGRPPSPGGARDRLIAVRVPLSLIEALDRYVEGARKTEAMGTVTRSDVVRHLLKRGLASPS